MTLGVGPSYGAIINTDIYWTTTEAYDNRTDIQNQELGIRAISEFRYNRIALELSYSFHQTLTSLMRERLAEYITSTNSIGIVLKYQIVKIKGKDRKDKLGSAINEPR